ncbi:2Fe-2S ferredoxin [bacterium]|nr:2Fe-2S ferredoxin [bacterium]
MPKVTFHIGDQASEVEGEAGKTILQIALDNGVPLEHACGGNGFCTTCLCKVKSGGENLGDRNDKEENMGITEESERLGCQATVNGDVELEVVDF